MQNKKQMKAERYRLRGLQVAVISFTIMALAMFAVQVIRMFEKSNTAELTYIGVMFAAWLLMLAGTRGLMKYQKNFRQSFYVTLPAICVTALWGILAVKNVDAGLGKQAFMSFEILLLTYLCFLFTLYAYAHILNGCSLICTDLSRGKLGRACRRVWKPCFLLIIAGLLCVQGAPLFSELIKYIITVGAALVMLICQLIMIAKILAVYDVADGRKAVHRLDDYLNTNTAEHPARAAEKNSSRQKAK